MKEYHKINTVFKRDPNNPKRLLEGQFSTPELEYLANNEWEFTEKIDGTNIRLIFSTPDPREYEPMLTVRGKTDEASIPTRLLEAIQRKFQTQGDDTTRIRRVTEIMQEHDLRTFTLYGEGYGAGIQKGGIYRPDPDFILFDVRAGDWWLEREQVVATAHRLRLDVVPVVGRGTLHDMVTIIKDRGYPGMMTYGGKHFEGLVARPVVTLFNRKGERIITKLKVKDFPG